jgi:hypothetical protein
LDLFAPYLAITRFERFDFLICLPAFTRTLAWDGIERRYATELGARRATIGSPKCGQGRPDVITRITAGLLMYLGVASATLGDEPPQASDHATDAITGVLVPHGAKLQGTDTGPLRVLIRQIDDGALLWVGKFKLGTTAVVVPGHHKVNVMCEFRQSWGTELKPGEVTVEADPDRIYDLVGKRSQDDVSAT